MLVVGPSGAGKDTLLGLARAACADDRNIVFPRRVITREASASEDNEEVSLGTFQEALARGEYAMHWEAHGHCYALSRAIDDEIRAGRTVVANVSRTVIARDAPRLCRRGGGFDHGAAERSGRTDCAARARQRRQARAAACVARVEDAAAAPDVTIVNISSAEYHARQLVRAIKGEKWDD